MKSLISGSHGFIGSHLAERLKQLGHTVVPIRRELLYSPNELEEFFKQESPDYIFHFAAYGNMSHQKEEQDIFKANVIGTWNMLSASKDINYQAFTNVGSSSEYGKKDKPMSETDLPETDTFYGASKVAGTYFARAFASQYNKPIVTVRPFSVYGPGEADYRFIPTVIKALYEKKPIRLADGCHDWIYIEDFINALIFATLYADQLKGEVLNLGSGRESGNSLVVAILQDLSGVQVQKLPYENARPHDSSMWKADISRLKKLGFRYQHSLEEGLTKTYEYYKQRFEA